MKKIAYFLFLLLFFTSCKSAFSVSEKKILYSEADSPAKVLKITNKKDSIILRTSSKNIKNIKNEDLSQLVKKLYLTMVTENGVGIAAPQIGINRNVFLFYRLDQEEKSVEVAINPRIISHSKELICFQNDGCLSVPGKYGNSKRYSWIKVKYIDQNGKKVKQKFYGGTRSGDYTGIIFQHEFDHINGKLYIDKICN